MNRKSTRIGFTCLLAAAFIAVWMTQSTAVADDHESKAISPVRFDPAIFAGKNLTELPALAGKNVGNPRRILEAASENPRANLLPLGDIVAISWESPPAELEMKNYIYDEFIEVLEGTLILTGEDGEAQRFEVGDHLTIPKGWSGIWEMQGDVYRELVVIERKTWEEDGAAE